MSDLLTPLFAEGTGWTVVIDGVTYRPPIVDTSGRVLVAQSDSDALRAALYGVDGSTQRQLAVDPDARALVSLDVDADDIRLANENYSAAQTNNELIAAPGAALVIYVTGIFFSTDAAVNMKLTQSSGSPSDVFGPHYFPANGGISAPTLSAPLKLNANSALRVTTVGVSNCTITVLAKVM